MNIYFDTEFYIPKDEWGVVRPISIGAIREDGKTFYAEIAEFDWNIVPKDDWLRQNVKPLLKPQWFAEPMADIREWLIDFAGSKPQFWAYSAAYDWVSMCVIMGGYLNIPENWSRTCFEIKQAQYSVDRSMPLPKQKTTEHHALNDAIWNRDIMWAIRDNARDRRGVLA